MRAIGILIAAFGILLAQDLPKRNLHLAMRTGPDPVRVDPAHYGVESDTDGMLALRLKLGPDESTPMAFIQDSLVVCLSECHVRLTLAILKKGTRQIVDIHMEAGTTRVMGAGMRAIENLSTKPVEMLFIERKDLGSDLK